MDRNIALEFVRATEAAAIAAAREKGRGDGRYADEVATTEMRARLNEFPINGVIVTGEGEKDARDAKSMLGLRERVGTGDGPHVDIAVDPLEGTSLTKNSQPGSLTVLAGAVAGQGSLTELPPAYYSQKIAVGFRDAHEVVSFERSTEQNLRAIAERLSKPLEQLTVVVLDRPRHEALIKEIRTAGARAQLIAHGDVGAAMETALPITDVDLLMGIGGLTEGYLAAVALRALGGSIAQRFFFKDEEEKSEYVQRAKQMGFELAEIERAASATHWDSDIVEGESFVALTGVTDGPIVKGVHFRGDVVETHSLVARSKSGTVRLIETWHQLNA